MAEKRLKKYSDINKKNLLLTSLLAIILFIVNIRHIAILNGPYMFNDELGYLGNAAALAGRDWHFIMQRCAWYSYGWSIIISPLFLIFSKMQIIYRCINIFNALCVVAIFLMQRNLLIKHFKDSNINITTAISAAVCFYPSILVNSSMAWCETWLLFAFTVITVFVYNMIQNPKTYKAGIFGLLLYYYYVCHNRMIAVIIAGVIIFIVLCIIKKYNIKHALLFVGSMVLSSVIFGLIKDYIISKNWPEGLPSGNDLESGLGVLSNLLSMSSIKNFIGVLCSQFLYICISSYGLVPLGLYFCICKIINSIKNHKSEESVFELWLALAFMGVFAISTLATGAQPDISSRRLDHIFYGRYFEPVFIFLIAYGFMHLSDLTKQTNHLAIYNTCYICIVGVCAIAGYLTVNHLKNPVFNKPNASGIAIYFEVFHNPNYFMFAAALLSIIGTIILILTFSNKNVFKYIGILGFSAVGFISMLSAEKSITVSQKNYSSEIPLINAIQAYDTADTPVFLLTLGNSYFQCMLTDIPLEFTRETTLSSIPNEKYYAIVSINEYFKNGFDISSEIIAQSSNNLFIYVDKSQDTNSSLAIPLELMHLKEISQFTSNGIHVDSSDEALAFYGPYITINAGDYELNAEIKITCNEALDNYGCFQIYSSASGTVISEFTLTSDMINTETNVVTIPFSLVSPIEDLEIYLRTKPGVSYDVNNLYLTKAYSFEYPLNSENGFFETQGFSHIETAGRWITDNTSEIHCFLPAKDYALTVDLGYSIPFEKLSIEDYSAEIYINNNLLGELNISSESNTDIYSFNVPKEYMTDGSNTVSISCDQLWSPSEFGSADTRQLGLNIEKIYFTPAA